MTCARSGLLGSTRLGGLGRRRFLVGNDVDVDAGDTCLMDNPPQDRPTVGEVPPAGLDGPNHDLSDLMLPCEADDGPGRIVILFLMPARAQVARQLSQLVYRPAFAGRAGVIEDDGEHVEFALD